MRIPIDRLFPKFRLSRSPLKRTQGFTLIELLVVVIIGSIIVTSLLSLVNELLKTNQRETAKSETQRDMQMSLDYIAADLREAAYVYDPTCHSAAATSCPSYRDFVPASVHTGIPSAGTQTSAGSLAVLAFWKVDPLSAEDIDSVEKVACATVLASSADLVKECDQVKRQKRSLTLVVYSQEWDAAGSTTSKWKGKSRIVRYELKKYKDLTVSGAAKFTRNQGYVDPLTDVGEPIFKTWPFNSAGTINCQTSPGAAPTGCGLKNTSGVSARPLGKGQVLSDFLDDVRQPVAARDFPTPICPVGEYTMGPRNTDIAANAPASTDNVASKLASTSFFVCIRGNLDTTTGKIKQPELGEVQDIVVFLRGNAYGRARFLQDAYLPTLQTTITLRGIINKNPN
jgi:prepilin-type N-terminal cleavage/methylation domain-containing protein